MSTVDYEVFEAIDAYVLAKRENNESKINWFEHYFQSRFTNLSLFDIETRVKGEETPFPYFTQEDVSRIGNVVNQLRFTMGVTDSESLYQKVQDIAWHIIVTRTGLLDGNIDVTWELGLLLTKQLMSEAFLFANE